MSPTIHPRRLQEIIGLRPILSGDNTLSCQFSSLCLIVLAPAYGDFQRFFMSHASLTILLIFSDVLDSPVE